MATQPKTMTAAEFLQLPETTQPTQLIHGEIIVSPSPKTAHQRTVLKLAFTLEQVADSGELLISPMDVHLDDENVVQPDLFWVADDSACKLGEDGYWHGPPDLVVEVVSPGSSRMDKVTKFTLYEQHGVREYWLVEPATADAEIWVRDEELFALQGTYDGAFTSPLLGEVDLTDVFA